MRYHARVAAAASLLIASAAGAQPAFDSLYPGGPSTTVYMMEAGSVQFPNHLAWRFTSQASGVVNDLTIGACRTSSSGAATMTLFEASGGQVGAALGSVAFTLPTQASPLVTVDASGLDIGLVQGRDYWLSLDLVGTTRANWFIYAPFVAGPEAYSVNNGPWVYMQAPQIYYPGMRITAPGPGVGVGALSAFVMMVALRRRR